MSGGSCHISAIRVCSSRAEAIAHKPSIVFELIKSGSAVFTQILHSFSAKSLRVPSTRCGLMVDLPSTIVYLYGTIVDLSGTMVDPFGTMVGLYGTMVDLSGTMVNLFCTMVDLSGTMVDLSGTMVDLFWKWLS